MTVAWAAPARTSTTQTAVTTDSSAPLTDTCDTGACVGVGDTCPGQMCDEVGDVCAECLIDDDCNDTIPCTLDVCDPVDGCSNVDTCPEGQECNLVTGVCRVEGTIAIVELVLLPSPSPGNVATALPASNTEFSPRRYVLS